MDNLGAEMAAIWIVTTVAALVVVWLVARSRLAAGLRLTVLGVVVALVALWYGVLTSLPGVGRAPVPLPLPGLADTALRLAAVLVLGGIVVSLLTRETAPTVPTLPEVSRNVPPSV